MYQWGTMASEHFDDEATIKWRLDSSNGDCVQKIVWKSSLITILYSTFVFTIKSFCYLFNFVEHFC
jgi:hypothetical protein